MATTSSSKAKCSDIDLLSGDDNIHDKETFSGICDKDKKTASSKLSRFKRTWAQSTLHRNFIRKKLLHSITSTSKERPAVKARQPIHNDEGGVIVVEGKSPEVVCISNNKTNEELIACNEKNGLVGLVSDKAAGFGSFGNGVIEGIKKACNNIEGTNNSPVKTGAEDKATAVTDCHKVACVVKDCDIISGSISKRRQADLGTIDLDDKVEKSIARINQKEQKKSFERQPEYSDVKKEAVCVVEAIDKRFQTKEFNNLSGHIYPVKENRESHLSGLIPLNDKSNIRNSETLNYVGNSSSIASTCSSNLNGAVKSFNVQFPGELKDSSEDKQEQDETLNEFLFTTLGIVSSSHTKGKTEQAGIEIHGPDNNKPHPSTNKKAPSHQPSEPKKEEERKALLGDVRPLERTLLKSSPGGNHLCEAGVGDPDSVCHYRGGQVNACLHDTSSPRDPDTCDTELRTQAALSSTGISLHIYQDNRSSDSPHLKSDSELVHKKKRKKEKCVVQNQLKDTYNNCGQSCNSGYSESNIYTSAETQQKFDSLCAGVNACNGDSLAQNQPKLQTTTLDLTKKLRGLPERSSFCDQKDKHIKSHSLGLVKKTKKPVHTAGFIEEFPSSKIQISSSETNTGEWRSERPSSVLKTKRHNKGFVKEQFVSVQESSKKKQCVLPSCNNTEGKEKYPSLEQEDKISLFEGSYTVNLDHHTTVSSTLSLASSVSSKGSSRKLSVKDLDKLVTKAKPKVYHVDYGKNKERNISHLSHSDAASEQSITPSRNSVDMTMYNSSYPVGNSVKQEDSVASNTSQDSGFVPGLVFTNRRVPYGYQAGSSSKYSDSSCQSSTHGDLNHNSRQPPQPHRLLASGQSDTSYGLVASSEDQHGPLLSRSHHDLAQRAPYGQDRQLYREYPDTYNSRHRPPVSLDSVSLGSSQASSLCLVTAPDAQNPDLVASQKHSHSFEGRLPVKGVVMREKRNQKRKSRKTREWGTVGNIPDVMENNNTVRHATRPKSFGAGEMYQTRRSFEMIDRIESESEDSDSSIDVDNYEDFSMAEDDSQAGGCSLDDKLRLAANKGQVERIPTLLAQGAGFLPDKEGRTAIHYAALSGYSEAVRILGANGCDVNTKDNLGYTALHRAAAQGHTEVVKVLCECGCNLNIQDDVHGNSALHEASWNGYSRTVDVLCRHKANVHLTNKAGFTALHLAAQNGHNQSGRHLLYANCDSNYKNNYGDTPLHTAGRYGHAGVTRILLSAKCRISEQNKNGDTALHIASALKRKKIAKLLVEANINISVKNKQNETAADVARRKEHHEIILIITSQAKLHKQKKKEDKKKKKEGKFSGIEESDDPRKDKKMFFFNKKRSKSKDNKENKENREASADRLDGRPSRGFVSSSMDAQAGVVSEALSNNSSGRGTFPDHHSRPSRDTQKSRSSSRERVTKSQGTSTGTDKRQREPKVHGLLTQYEPKQGVQYYRDLAGNIKQGPIGFTPVCKCGPSIKKIEQRMEADRNNLYDHIDATHKMLSHQIEDVDHRCSERVQECRLHCDTQDAQVKARVLQERQDTEQTMRFQEHLMRAEYMDYMSHKLGALEEHYAPMKSSCKGCDHCKQQQQHGQHTQHHHGHYRDDTDLRPTRAGYAHQQQQAQNGLYRSKSDETLSVTSSKKHWKMKGKPKSIRQMKEKRSRGGGEGHKGYSGWTGYESSSSRPAPQGEMVTQVVYHQTSTPLAQEDNKAIQQHQSSAGSGRTPEGQSSNNEYSEHNSYLDPSLSHYGTWNTRAMPKPSSNQPALSHPSSTNNSSSLSHPDKDSILLRQDFEKLTVRDFPQSSLSNGHSTSTPISQQQQQSGNSRPGSAQAELHTPDSLTAGMGTYPNDTYNPPYNTPVFNSPNYNTPNSSYTNTHNSSSRLTTSGSSSYVLSPDQVQVHHVKTDSGSNPDSGYSSKIYGMRPAVSGRSISTSQGGSPNNLPYPVINANSHLPHQNAIVPEPTQVKDNASGKTVHKSRGYSSDGCPGMRRPKPDVYASDNCSGMRMKKAPPHKSALNDWYEKQVSAKGNGVIKEVPTPPPKPTQKPKDFWPGKATQV